MIGFTGEYYNGIPVFIRDEYERANAGKTETERLGDMLGASYSSLFGAMDAAKNKDERLLYNTGDEERDGRLRRWQTEEDMWHPYKSGYVHEITGEYTEGLSKPNYESFPAWRFVPVGYGSGGKTNGLVNLLYLLTFFSEIFKK